MEDDGPINQMDIQYKELIKRILSEGTHREERTGVGATSVFGAQMRFQMSEGFPLLSLRKIHVPSLVHELLWFLGSYDEIFYYKEGPLDSVIRNGRSKIPLGNTNIRYLLENGVTFWSDWPHKNYVKETGSDISIKDFERKILEDEEFAWKYGSIGEGYGKQWTDWEGINQIDNLIDTLKTNPTSRRMIVNAWNTSKIDQMLLPPCHVMFQLFAERIEKDDRYDLYLDKCARKKYDPLPLDSLTIRELDEFKIPKWKLSMQMYQRSADVYLGLPYNVASYSLLLHMIARTVNMVPNEFIWVGGDVHLYDNSMDATMEVLGRETKSSPRIKLVKRKRITEYRYGDVKFVDYKPHPNIKVEVAV